MKFHVLNQLFRQLAPAVAFSLVWSLPAQAGVLTVKNKTAKGPQKLLWLFTPTPLPVETNEPALAIMPLLGPAGELMPGGQLLVWVGLTNGEPLANVEVRLRVPEGAGNNALVGGGQRISSIVLQSDANGLCRATFAAPDKPREKDGTNNNGGGSGGGSGGSPAGS